MISMLWRLWILHISLKSAFFSSTQLTWLNTNTTFCLPCGRQQLRSLLSYFSFQLLLFHQSLWEHPCTHIQFSGQPRICYIFYTGFGVCPLWSSIPTGISLLTFWLLPFWLLCQFQPLNTVKLWLFVVNLSQVDLGVPSSKRPQTCKTYLFSFVFQGQILLKFCLILLILHCLKIV